MLDRADYRECTNGDKSTAATAPHAVGVGKGIGKEKAGRVRRGNPAGLEKDAGVFGGVSKDSLRPHRVKTERTAHEKTPGGVAGGSTGKSGVSPASLGIGRARPWPESKTPPADLVKVNRGLGH
jgi:hypothetical protein